MARVWCNDIEQLSQQPSRSGVCVCARARAREREGERESASKITEPINSTLTSTCLSASQQKLPSKPQVNLVHFEGSCNRNKENKSRSVRTIHKTERSSLATNEKKWTCTSQERRRRRRRRLSKHLVPAMAVVRNECMPLTWSTICAYTYIVCMHACTYHACRVRFVCWVTRESPSLDR